MRAFIDRFTNGANLGEGVSILSSGVFNIKLALVHHKTQRPALSSPCTASVIWSVLSLLPLARITSFLHCVLRDQPYHTFRDRFGRRAAMFVGGVIICIGTAVMSTSALANQFIAGRFIVGFGISFMITAGPTYVAEIAPPQWRGRFTASSSCELSFARLVDYIDALHQVLRWLVALSHLLLSSAPRRSRTIGRGVSPLFSRPSRP